MSTTDPDFEALKAITRLSWLLDVNPLAIEREREAIQADAPLGDRT